MPFSTDAPDSLETTSADATAAPEREVLGWEQFGEASRELARKVHASGFDPEIVVAIARGGLLLAGSIAYALDVKSCGALNVEFYTGVDRRLPEPIVLPPALDQPSLIGKRVLVVDDVSDSGRTLDMVMNLLSAVGADVQSVVLYDKPGTLHVPHFSWKTTAKWINFPWSTLPPVTAEA
jgi:uncharacterized protein